MPRAANVVAGAIEVHALPLHSQVSNNSVPLAWRPPNTTTRLRSESNTMPWPWRTAGPLALANCHDVPFHSQTSPWSVAPELRQPPNITVRPRALS